MELYESLDELEEHVEPLLVEEVVSAFDREARPIEIALAEGRPLISLRSDGPDLPGLKAAVSDVPWLLASDLRADEESVPAYVNSLLNAYALAVERVTRRGGWFSRLLRRT